MLEGGSLGNASFVAIPYNANAKAGAMVIANLLLSPQAQARMASPDELGFGTVLAMDRLSDDQVRLFDEIPVGIATLTPEELGPTLPEPHPSWMEKLEEDWTSRYGVAP